MRLLNLIVYQGDTEFASVEQQRRLFETAPSEHDRQSLCRVVTEEMRHGWQMCYLLMNHFGYSGRVEAQKMLERRAFDQKRLLGAFNQDVNNWLDFFVYTDFVDRDGKYQLTMLSFSGFAPLAQSMIPMLKEESFHLGTGQDGIKRIVKAGVDSAADHSEIHQQVDSGEPGSFRRGSLEFRALVLCVGLKGRYDEPTAQAEANLERMNEHSRELYRQECVKLVDMINKNVPAGQPKLYVPDVKFNRYIGEHARQPYSVTGELLSEEGYRGASEAKCCRSRRISLW